MSTVNVDAFIMLQELRVMWLTALGWWSLFLSASMFIIGCIGFGICNTNYWHISALFLIAAVICFK